MVKSKAFDWAAFIVLLCFMLTLSLEHFQMTGPFTLILMIADSVFIALLAIEVGIRIFGLRQEFHKNWWNIYDLVVLVICVVGKYLSAFPNLQTIGHLCVCFISELLLSDYVAKYSIATVFLRLIRLGRFDYLLLSLPGLKDTSAACKRTTKALINLCLTLILVQLTYALLGMALFNHVKQITGLSSVINFESLGKSFVVLIQVCLNISMKVSVLF